MDYDVIIIGGGAAGLSAAFWCDELKLKTCLLETEKELGGQLLWIHNQIKNHLGVEARNGRELRDIFVKQIKDSSFTIYLESEVREINLTNKTIKTKNDETFSAKAIIIAAGIRRKKLNVEGEEEFKGKGIIESGKRDANQAKGKNVLVVGGGDAAFENALILAETAAGITLAHRGENFRARSEFTEQAENNPKIKIFTETVIRQITGGERVETVELENLTTKKVFNVNAETVLIRIGIEPNTEILRGGRLDIDEKGFIKINQNCETSVKGVFAIGDIANAIAPTVSSAVGMGATAAKTISSQLRTIE